jgi:hypothetical protein
MSTFCSIKVHVTFCKLSVLTSGKGRHVAWIANDPAACRAGGGFSPAREGAAHRCRERACRRADHRTAS